MKTDDIDIDTSVTMRVLVTLRLLIEEPDVYTKASLSAKIGVSKDSLKKYFAGMRRAGFNVKSSGYPDYTYSIELIDEVKSENLVTNFSSNRHKKSKS